MLLNSSSKMDGYLAHAAFFWTAFLCLLQYAIGSDGIRDSTSRTSCSSSMTARLSTRTSSTPAPTGDAYRSVVVEVASLPVHRLSLFSSNRPLMGVCWNWCGVTWSPFSLKKPSTRKDQMPRPKMNLNTTRVLGDILWDILYLFIILYSSWLGFSLVDAGRFLTMFR
uniref:(northern house mosquito) hypothetical protein n=1 Tax=Culex pipiens TaxID=7175 RepID=A0A8D8KNJ6_CULPI